MPTTSSMARQVSKPSLLAASRLTAGRGHRPATPGRASLVLVPGGMSNAPAEDPFREAKLWHPSRRPLLQLVADD